MSRFNKTSSFYPRPLHSYFSLTPKVEHVFNFQADDLETRRTMRSYSSKRTREMRGLGDKAFQETASPLPLSLPTVHCQDGPWAFRRQAAARRSCAVYNCFGLDTVWYGKQTRTSSMGGGRGTKIECNGIKTHCKRVDPSSEIKDVKA